MRHLLSVPDIDVLREFAAANVVLAFDFDGTLAPIVPRPDDAQMRAETRRLLGQAAQLYPVVVISGRGQEDVRSRLGPVPVWDVVGNHGLEPHDSAHRFERQVRGWLPLLQERLGELDGVVIEDKRLSVAVHYRASRHKKKALAEVARAVVELEGARVLKGKQVINLIPEGGPNKGAALVRLQLKLGCTAAVYAGDDETDEDVFALRKPGLLCVRVGRKSPSSAPYFLHRQAEIDGLLQRLVELRKKPSERRRIG